MCRHGPSAAPVCFSLGGRIGSIKRNPKMTNPQTCFICAVVAALCLSPAIYGAEKLEEEGKLDQILNELRQVRALIERQQEASGPRLARGEFEVGDAPFLGSKDAPLTVVEFTDYQCPYCRQFHQNTFADLKKHYIDSGKVRFYVKDLPGPNHKDAARAAQAAHCAREQQQFWPLHDRMQSNPDRLGPTDLFVYAEEIGMDVDEFRSCLESDRYEEMVRTAARDAIALGAQGTPTFLIGRSTGGGVEGEWVIGAMPFGVFQRKLDAYSAGKDPANAPPR